MPDTGKAVCWLTINNNATRLYASNTGDPSVSVYDISQDPTEPLEIQTLTYASTGNGFQFGLDSTGSFLHVVTQQSSATADASANAIHIFRVATGRHAHSRFPPRRRSCPCPTWYDRRVLPRFDLNRTGRPEFFSCSMRESPGRPRTVCPEGVCSMKNPFLVAVLVGTLALASSTPVRGDDKKPASAPAKKVLVELYTSQGCDSCLGRRRAGRPADDALGYGADRIVPIAFHVDYFNDPWVDPFSNPEFSRRQMSYQSVQRRNDLYFTPMMMVDGRDPMLGSDRTKAVAAIEKALTERPAVSIKLDLDRNGRKGNLSVELTAHSNEPIGRALLVGVAITESPVKTDVRLGENAGKTLVEYHAVRSFRYKSSRLDHTQVSRLSFPLNLGAKWIEERCRVTIFVQDRANGKVYQADSLAWVKSDQPPQ